MDILCNKRRKPSMFDVVECYKDLLSSHAQLHCTLPSLVEFESAIFYV